MSITINYNEKDYLEVKCNFFEAKIFLDDYDSFVTSSIIGAGEEGKLAHLKDIEVDDGIEITSVYSAIKFLLDLIDEYGLRYNYSIHFKSNYCNESNRMGLWTILSSSKGYKCEQGKSTIEFNKGRMDINKHMVLNFCEDVINIKNLIEDFDRNASIMISDDSKFIVKETKLDLKFNPDPFELLFSLYDYGILDNLPIKNNNYNYDIPARYRTYIERSINSMVLYTKVKGVVNRLVSKGISILNNKVDRSAYIVKVSPVRSPVCDYEIPVVVDNLTDCYSEDNRSLPNLYGYLKDYIDGRKGDLFIIYKLYDIIHYNEYLIRIRDGKLIVDTSLQNVSHLSKLKEIVRISKFFFRVYVDVLNGVKSNTTKLPSNVYTNLMEDDLSSLSWSKLMEALENKDILISQETVDRLIKPNIGSYIKCLHNVTTSDIERTLTYSVSTILD